MLPTVTAAAGAGGGIGGGSGFNLVYMRGVATGGDGQATTSQPSVGMYLDEQPITTIQGNLDVHLYDIARVEALAGPAGHAVRRELAGGHDPHHHQQAGSVRLRRGLLARRQPRRRRRHRLRRGGIRQHPDRRQRGHPPRRLDAREAGWIDNVAATRLYAGRSPHDRADDFLANNARFRGGQLQHDRHDRRARGTAHQPRRKLGDHAERDVPEDGPGRLLGRRPQRLRRRARTRSRTSATSSPTTSGTRPA